MSMFPDAGDIVLTDESSSAADSSANCAPSRFGRLHVIPVGPQAAGSGPLVEGLYLAFNLPLRLPR